MTDIKSMTKDELKNLMTELGEKPFRAKQIYSWLHEHLVTSYDEMGNIPGKLKEKLEEKENIHIIDLGGCIKASEYFAKQDDPKIKKIKEDIQLYEEEKETIKNNDTDWMNIFKKKEKINELNRLLIDELIEDIVVSEDGNIKVIFKYEDKYFEALDFINKQNYDIISSS